MKSISKAPSFIFPFIFITITTLTSLVLKAQSYVGTNRFLLVIVGILFSLILWMLYEGWTVYKTEKQNN